MSSSKLVYHSLFKQLKSCAIRRGRRLNVPSEFHPVSFRQTRLSSSSYIVRSLDKDLTSVLYLVGVVGATTGALSLASVTLTESVSLDQEEEEMQGLEMDQVILQWLMEQTETYRARFQTVINELFETGYGMLKPYFQEGLKDENEGTNIVDDSISVPRFPSLSAHVVNSSGELQEFHFNSQSGIPFETDYFVGQVLVVLVPPNDPAYENTFLSDNTRFQLQLQGRFKQMPKGVVYCGAEITQRPTLDPVSKGLYSILLHLLKRMIGSNMHYSFGSRLERPHIVFPAWTAMDALIATKPGDVTPQLGKPFVDSSRSPPLFNTTDTYSMSFRSARVDLPTWRMVNLGVLQDQSLQSYWGKSVLRLVLYEKCGDDQVHASHDNKYLMELQVNFLGDSCIQSKTDEAPLAGKGARLSSTVESN